MDHSILMILGHMVKIDETLKFTQCQGHKVKGQGDIQEKNTFGGMKMCICDKQTRLTLVGEFRS